MRSQEASGGHRKIQASRRPQQAPGGPRMPQEAPGGHRKRQEAQAIGGPERPQEQEASEGNK
eukprot:4280247-Pyramimonas_sp.AAC.1